MVKGVIRPKEQLKEFSMTDEELTYYLSSNNNHKDASNNDGELHILALMTEVLYVLNRYLDSIYCTFIVLGHEW